MGSKSIENKMRKLFLLFAVISLSFTINAQTTKKKAVSRATKTVVAQNPGYVVSGTVEGVPDGTKVYIAEMQGYFSFVPSDSTLVKNGRYEMKGQQKQPVLRFVMAVVDKSDPLMAQFILENTHITINLTKDPKTTVVIGGRDNELWAEFNKKEEDYNSKVEPTWKIANDSTKTQVERDSAQKKLDEFNKLQNAKHTQFLVDNIPSGVSSILLGYYYTQLDEPTLTKILALMKEKCPNDEVYREIVKEREITKKTGVGAQYTDIALNTPEGKLIKVSDFVGKNKVTMIDFWASWCGPCRQEMPNVIKAYNEYKEKGFAVVGVSLDNNKKAWKEAIQKLGIPWPQMSDLKGWQSAGAALYNVRSIPATILIDQKGKIIAKDLRGEELEIKLKEILK